MSTSSSSSSVSSSSLINSSSLKIQNEYDFQSELLELEAEKMNFSLYFEECLASTSIQIQSIEEVSLAKIINKHRMLKRKQRKSMRKTNNKTGKGRKCGTGDSFRNVDQFSEFKYSSCSDQTYYCVEHESTEQNEEVFIWHPIPIIEPISSSLLSSTQGITLLQNNSNLNNANNNNNNDINNTNGNNCINDCNRQFEANDPNQQCQRADQQQ